MDTLATTAYLMDIFTEMQDSFDYEKAVERLNGETKINQLVNYLIYGIDEYSDSDKTSIEFTIKILQEVYNNSDVVPPIPDELFDTLYEVYLNNTNQNIIGAIGHSSGSKKVSAHKYTDLRGTLDKIHFVRNDEKKPKEKRKSLEDWVNSIRNKLDLRLLSNGVKIELFPKWDGISGIFECNADGTNDKVLKRGDTARNEAEEMTDMFSKGTNMIEYRDEKYSGPFGLKSEIVMSRDNYKLLCSKYGEFKSPRSAVSSILNTKDFDQKYLPYLTIIPLQIQDWETKDVYIPSTSYTEFPYEESNLLDFDDIKYKIKLLAKQMKGLGIDVDGVVIRIADKHLQKKLGREDNINKYEIAYKFPPEQKKTILKDVFMSVGKLGAVTPVAKIEPVKIKGNTISNISLGSMDRFEGLKLNKGDEVIIKYDVIPYLDIDESCKKGSGECFTVPTQCPYCNQKLEKEPILRCVNMDCSSRIIGKILNFVTKMAIPNISIGIITALYNNGILKNIGDLYQLNKNKDKIVTMDGFGEKSFDKIIQGVESRKEVLDYELVGSLGIPDVGRKIFKKIFDLYNMKDLIKISETFDLNKLTKIAGIKEVTASKVINGVNQNIDLIQELKNELDVSRDNRSYTVKVVFTKVRDKEFMAYLDTKDVLVMDGFSNDVDMVIVPDYTTSSSKIDKAIKQGKEIISINDAYKLFGYTKE